jgi:hypothetical protein
MNQQHVQQVFHGLEYSFADFSLDHFVHHVSQRRQRPIFRVPVSFSPGISGAWVPRTALDFIFYRSNVHPIHQAHIVLHELAHMLLAHPLRTLHVPLPLDDQQDNELIQGHLRTITFNRLKDDHEREAEYFVELIQKQVVYADRLDHLTMGGSSIEALHPFVIGLPFAGAGKK